MHNTNMKCVPRLSILYLYLTNKCNLHCIHCWIDGDSSNNQFINTEHLKETVKSLKSLGLKQVNITGGEPTLHRDFVDIIEFFYNNDINIYVNTNGLLLTEEMCKLLGKYRDRLFFSVSVDGAVSATHDSIRGMNGAYDLTWAGIDRLMRYAVECEIIFTIQKRNMLELENIIKMCAEKSVSALRINFLQYSSGKRVNALKEEEGNLSIESILSLNDLILQMKAKYRLKIFTNLPFSFYLPNEIIEMKHRVCGIKRAIGILPDGTVSLCGVGELKSELIMGNISESSIEEIWNNNDLVNYIRYKLPDDIKGVCNRCTLRNICCGYCVAQNYMESGKINSSYSLCERLYENGLFPKKYLENQ